ncbi:MAG: hypothetical protein A2826_00420 [Candidatus Doudnabacteria bacterium RIFCSPHIGHO2_01_FULL_43_23]|uniref:Amino acid transporter transmembrane domain-containing protein n=1 Tax=Candidatus Doudnabacteria bacterium RIFCSPHIGHO2_01_FULL_43_23 TaxID=1817822 RepID=A0A1F5NST0_9BACT|nr:MAG: hypothetical protein A2826_00420 [Candidatus Doudnabacteria bacterium RIFCSPHIGHO2_01_FULL_43_23]
MEMKNIETKSLQFVEAVALLVGTVVGAGFLGIPFVVARVGLILGLLLIIGIGLLAMILFLVVTEITLRTKTKHQIPGYISQYLGPKWRKFTFIVLLSGGYGALLSYLVGEGQVLSAIFGGPPIIYSVLFFAVTAVFVFRGLKTIELVDLFLILFMALVVILIGLLSANSIQYQNLSHFNLAGILPAYGVILFSFLGVSAVPEMRAILTRKEKQLPKAVFIAVFIPMIIYVLFTVAVVGVNGVDTSPVATIGLGQALGRNVEIVGNILAVITMTTAFLGMGLAMKETYHYDLKVNKNLAWGLTMSVPFILLLLGLTNFTTILSLVGSLFGGIMGVLIIVTWWKAKKLGDRKPEFILHHKKLFGYLLIIVFSLGFIYTVFDLL